MIYTIFFILVFVAPSLWLKYTFKKNDRVLEEMPFSPRELGNTILKELEITTVSFEETKTFDHYDPESKTVRLLADRFDRKSLTAISIICHEIGHAIQDHNDYKPLKQRTDIIKKTSWLSRISNTVMLFAVPAILATGAYSFLKICVIIISISTLIGLFTHLITLEVEIDASFNRAMPILQEKIPHMYHDACRSVLKAAAFTYVASVFANVFSFRYLWLLLTRAV
ncbi:MAG: zinc metallopeptidase [SAR92 clade bacterium]|uniref:Zinc metallopeptidase n=1 Tax=SAR92 clade bacterium TaxID=2315479 RepID=A0A520LK45_9GAMM|nr:MAG: zinc metallopeptidase [SAR92 clade bacterium]